MLSKAMFWGFHHRDSSSLQVFNRTNKGFFSSHPLLIRIFMIQTALMRGFSVDTTAIYVSWVWALLSRVTFKDLDTQRRIKCDWQLLLWGSNVRLVATGQSVLSEDSPQRLSLWTRWVSSAAEHRARSLSRHPPHWSSPPETQNVQDRWWFKFIH